MQYVALVECLQLIRGLAAKAGAVAAAAAAGVATGKGGSAGGASAAGPAAVKGMEELAHALGALEALLSEGAGDTSASGERDQKQLVFVGVASFGGHSHVRRRPLKFVTPCNTIGFVSSSGSTRVS